MFTFSQRMLGNLSQVSAALELEPGIRPDFARADLRTVVRVMYAVMSKGSITAAGLYRYLQARGCPFDRETIEFLLDAYEGGDSDHHLWERRNLGDFYPLEGVVPPGD